MKDFNKGEFAGDELEIKQYEYAVEAVRNQYPQLNGEDSKWNQKPLKPKSKTVKPAGGDGNIPNEAYNRDVDQPYSDIAEYTMIPDPLSEDRDANNTNGS